MRKARVIQDHSAESNAPLIIAPGDIIEGIHKPSKYSGWLHCHDKKHNYAWVPETYLQPLSDRPGFYRVLKKYSSQEINAQERQVVEIMLEESGWALVKKRDGVEGWIPMENLSELD